MCLHPVGVPSAPDDRPPWWPPIKTAPFDGTMADLGRSFAWVFVQCASDAARGAVLLIMAMGYHNTSWKTHDDLCFSSCIWGHSRDHCCGQVPPDAPPIAQHSPPVYCLALFMVGCHVLASWALCGHHFHGLHFVWKRWTFFVPLFLAKQKPHEDRNFK